MSVDDSDANAAGAEPGSFADELKLLAEQLLERVEPALRHTASGGDTASAGCSWCPLCAAAALVRAEHHHVLSALAGHGTAIVVILREALAGVPVEPRLPVDQPDTEPESAQESRREAAETVRFVDIPVTIRS